MDKVKIALAVLKKHHFWVMTGLIVLLSFIGWFLATSKLWADYQTSKAKIEGEFKALTEIKSKERENDKWIKGLDAETQQLKVKVRTAWEKVYTEQKTNVLIWPAVLGPNHKAVLDKLPPNAEIPKVICRAYSNYIRNEFPRLLEIVNARDEHGTKVTLGEKKPSEDGADTATYKVVWNSANQAEIYSRLDWVGVPSSAQVRELQEDLWVYHALLKIISNLNEFATGNYNAKVKEIQSILIGSDAAKVFHDDMAEGRLDKPTQSASGPKQGGAASLGTVSSVGRYVDAKGEPLAEGAAAPPEFKRMPVVMQLVMDQREIMRLLVECANSPLPVEVRHLHIHGKPTGGKPGQASTKENHSHDMIVEVEGLIYIFNPPDPAKLGAVAAAEPGAAAAAATPPANPGGGEPAAKAGPAADAGAAAVEGEKKPAPAPAGKAASEPDAAGAEPEAAPDGADPDAEPGNMEKTDAAGDEMPQSK